MAQHLKVFTSKYIDTLKKNLTPALYKPGSNFLVDETQVRTSAVTKVADITPTLNPDKTFDTNNAILVYEFLPINPTQASDGRLWAYMTHITFRNYTLQRWKLNDAIDERKQKDFIISHWFTNGSSRSLRRNAISRLWWAAYLTAAPWEKCQYFAPLRNEDRYVYTKILMSNQDVAQQILERQLSWSQPILISILEFLRNDREFLSNRFLCREFMREINLTLAYRKLMNLDLVALLAEMDKIATDIRSFNKGNKPDNEHSFISM